MLAIEKIFPGNSFNFIQESAPSHHTNTMRNKFKEKLKTKFMKSSGRPLQVSSVYIGKAYTII